MKHTESWCGSRAYIVQTLTKLLPRVLVLFPTNNLKQKGSATTIYY